MTSWPYSRSCRTASIRSGRAGGLAGELVPLHSWEARGGRNADEKPPVTDRPGCIRGTLAGTRRNDVARPTKSRTESLPSPPAPPLSRLAALGLSGADLISNSPRTEIVTGRREAGRAALPYRADDPDRREHHAASDCGERWSNV